MSHSGGDVDNERGFAFVGVGCIWKISVTSAQFCCEHKTIPKTQSFMKCIWRLNSKMWKAKLFNMYKYI